METPGIVLSTLNFMAVCLSLCHQPSLCLWQGRGHLAVPRLLPSILVQPGGCHSPQVWGGGLEPGPKGWLVGDPVRK